MSKPEADQIAIIHSVPNDKAEVISGGDEVTLNGIGKFLSSLLEYF